jgi:hypothetical protein
MSDRFKLLFATIVCIALLTSPPLLAEETPPAEIASDTKVTKPTLNELMVRFAEIEKSYLPLHVRYRQTYGRPKVLAETDSEAAKLHYDSKYEMVEIGQLEKQVWFMNTKRFSDGVSAGTESRRSNMNGVYNIISGEGELRSNSFTFHDEDPENHDYVRSLLLAGVFPIRIMHPETGMLVSDYFQEDPSRIKLSWDGELAKLEFELQSSAPSPNQNRTLHDDAVDTPQFYPLERFQLWLDPAQQWHPSRLRRSLFSTPEVLIEEWRVTKFSQDSGVPRILEASLGTYESDPTVNIIVEESEFGAEVDADLFPANEVLLQKAPVAGGAQAAAPEGSTHHTPTAPQAPAPDVLIDDAEISDRLLPLILELKDLKSKLGNSHPKVIALERRHAFTRDFLNKFAKESQKIQSSSDQTKIFNLKNSIANDVAPIIRQLFNGATVSLDNRTNALIVRATELHLREIEAVLLRLDSTETAVKNSETTNQPGIDANTPVSSIAEYRRQLDALEQPVLQLAEQVREAETKQGKDHPDSAKLRADLRAAVQQTFAARQKIQRAELAEFTRRLQRMQQSIDSRDRIVDQIVDRRVEELLEPDARWDGVQQTLQPSNSAEIANGLPTEFHGTPEPTTGQSKEPSPFGSTLNSSELLPTIDAMLRDIEEFQQRTPLKLLLQFKDEPVLQISSDFYETVRTLKENVEQNHSNTKLKESFGHVASQGKSFVSKFSGLQNQGVQDTLRALEHGIATIRKLIDLDTADAVFIGEQDSQPSETRDVTASPTPPSEISVADESLTADADAAAESERAEAVLVDLKPYYSGLAKDFEKATRFPWKWVPRGSQTFANVPLDIGGRICLWGERNANVNGQVFPEKVEGIAIDREFETLFIYHCTFFESPQGTPVYELVFHYEDNTSASDTIRYLDDVRDWYCYPDEKQPGPTSDRSALAWHGATIIENGANPGDIQSLQFCLTAIENPHPDRKVKSVDLVSSKNQSAGCILAMTLGKSTLMRRVAPESD